MISGDSIKAILVLLSRESEVNESVSLLKAFASSKEELASGKDKSLGELRIPRLFPDFAFSFHHPQRLFCSSSRLSKPFFVSEHAIALGSLSELDPHT